MTKRLNLSIYIVLFSFLLFVLVALLYYQFGGHGQEPSLPGKLNISWFVYRDVNRNGVYDTEDYPYSGYEISLKRPDGSSVSATSNINGFANFRMSRDPKRGIIHSEGKYQLIAGTREGWEITSGTDTVDIEFSYLDHSPAGIIANSVADPLGVAPIPSISGRVDIEKNGYAIRATDPSGKEVEVKLDQNGGFQLTGSPGSWAITLKNQTTGAERTKDVSLGYYPVFLSGSFFESPDSNTKRHLISVDYDHLTESGSIYEIPNGYEGLNWKNWIATHKLFYKGSGYVNAVVSSEYIAYTSSGHPGTISGREPFDFIATYIGVAWPAATEGLVRIEGYQDTHVVYKDALKLSDHVPVYFHANYSNITSLKIYSDIYWQVILENSLFGLSTGSL